MTNPLFLRYGFLSSLRLDYKTSLVFERVVALSPCRCPLRILTSPLTRHSMRCYHLSRHYLFPSHISTLGLLHNIYGTSFLANSRFSDFINPTSSNRCLVAHLIGRKIECAISDYSVLTEELLDSRRLSTLSNDILSLVFINTIEIVSSINYLYEPYRREKLAFTYLYCMLSAS